jgi:hypothetical protein
MEWHYTPGASKSDVINELRNQNHVQQACLRANVLWLLTDECISAAFLQANSEGHWGYRLVSEMDGLNVFSCPLSYLKAPTRDVNPSWRSGVIRYYRSRRKAQKVVEQTPVGGYIKLRTGDSVRLTSRHPLMGKCRGNKIRFTLKDVEVSV